ncbi:MAG: DMT family transporter [Bacteroidales bacterium]|jgi:drug/metabolite transporter (DMT)-like permease|nr:DMT family transporter [Bacteroidales bacterium]
MNNKAKGHVAILSANIIFGLNTPISRGLMPDTLSPYALTFFRMAGAMCLFWLVSLFSKREKVPLKDIGLLFGAGMFGILINQMIFLIGLSKSSPIDSSMVLTLLPVFSMCLAAFILKEPVTIKKVAGVVIGAMGALLLITHNSGGQIGSGSLAGTLLVMCSSLSYAFYLTVFKSLISRYSPVTTMKWMFLFASLMALPFCWRSITAVDYAMLSGVTCAQIGYVVCGATFLSYLLIPIGQKSLRPTTLSMYNYLQPIVASLVAIGMGLDSFSMEKIVSGLLIFAGVFLVTRSKSREQMRVES